MARPRRQKPVVNQVTHLMVDIDGVVATGRPTDGAPWSTDLQADLGISKSDLRTAFFQPFWHRVVTGQLPLRPTLARALVENHLNVDADKLIAYWFANDARLDTSLLADLAQARMQGIKVIFATNQEHERARYLWQDLALSNFADGMFTSAQLGVKKPDPAFFSKAAHLTDAQPGAHLLIDDTLANIKTARAQGWHAHLWNHQHCLAAIIGQ